MRDAAIPMSTQEWQRWKLGPSAQRDITWLLGEFNRTDVVIQRHVNPALAEFNAAMTRLAAAFAAALAFAPEAHDA